MGDFIELVAEDGHHFDVYQALPDGSARGGIILLQEIFGVNRHIQALADGYAAEGYAVLAPALYDRIEKKLCLSYADFARAREYKFATPDEVALQDITACFEALAPYGRRATIGYCWGGYLSFMAACHLNLECAVVYYGGGITGQRERKPRCPVLYHFGERDQIITVGDVEKIHQSQKALGADAIFHIYDGADHGFVCDERGSYDPKAAALSRKRTLDFLKTHL